jgi:hypothetical protein
LWERQGQDKIIRKAGLLVDGSGTDQVARSTVC